MSRFSPQNLGIHARVMSAAVILICMATFTLGYLGVNIINSFITQRFSQRIDFMTRYLALNSELGILIGEQKLLQGLARNTLNEEDIQGVEIQDKAGDVLVQETRQIPGPYRIVEKSVYLTNADAESPWLSRGGRGPDREFIGMVRVIYSVRGIENLILKMTRRLIYSAVALALVAGVIFYFISRSLVAPVTSLAETARKVSMGNRNIRAQRGTTPEIAKLADAFNEMLDSIAAGRKTLVRAYEKMTRQEALAEVGKFSMMIAHEVKNPLAIIKSSLEMLKTDLDIPRENIPLTYAEEEIVRLNDLIESFLIFSRPAKPKFARTDLNHLVEQVMTGFDIQYDSGDISLDSKIPDVPFMAEADFDLLSRGISNIIKNACEANGHKGMVGVDVRVRLNKWELMISDQGPGIKEENRKQIFDPFFTTKATGTGLGLAFADQVVKAHGGSIDIGPAEGGGCCFTITLFSSIYGQPFSGNGQMSDVPGGEGHLQEKILQERILKEIDKEDNGAVTDR